MKSELLGVPVEAALLALAAVLAVVGLILAVLYARKKRKATAEAVTRPRSPLRWVWRVCYLLFFATVGCYVALVLLPALKSPQSRVYASLFGYPALQRYMGQPIHVEIEKAHVRPMAKTIVAEGQLDYLNLMPVQSEVLGVITSILAEPGRKVKKGDVLFKVHPGVFATRMLELTRDQKRLDLSQAQTNMTRQEDLFKKKATSTIELELARLAVKQAETAVAFAEEEYMKTMMARGHSVIEGRALKANRDYNNLEVDIVASAAGTVVRRLGEIGQNLVAEDQRTTLMTIGDRLVFRAQVDQRYAPDIKVGDHGKFYLRAAAGIPLDGEVLKIDPIVQSEPQTTPSSQFTLSLTQDRSGYLFYPYTFSVWMAINPETIEERSLLSGMNGYCIFERPYEALSIPEGALMRYSGRTGTVLIVDDDHKIQIKEVSYTGTQQGWVAIESGLPEGASVVVSGKIALKPGDTVAVSDESLAEVEK